MKELETIKTKIAELEAKKEALTAELGELSQAIHDSFEDLLLGKVDEATIDAAKGKFEALSAELTKTEEYIQRANAVRKQLAVAKFIPFAKENRQKRTAEIQAKYDEQIKAVHQARKAFLDELAALGKIRKEVSSANDEFNSIMRDIGEEPSAYGTAIQERAVIGGEWTTEAAALGIKENTQRQIYSSGIVPNDFGGDSIGNVGN